MNETVQYDFEKIYNLKQIYKTLHSSRSDATLYTEFNVILKPNDNNS